VLESKPARSHGTLTERHRHVLVVPVQYPTIQTAIDAAQPGHIVKVLAGTYVDRVRVLLIRLCFRRLTRQAGEHQEVRIIEIRRLKHAGIAARSPAANRPCGLLDSTLWNGRGTAPLAQCVLLKGQAMHTVSHFTIATWVAPRLIAIRDSLVRGLHRRRARTEARLTAQALERLDDRTLHDLGFCRGDAGAIGAELHGLRPPTLRFVIRVS
jgi:uncharacterized protein YjiS (DUF1127 family)